jgi:antitoxin (DNA-binding transcriptional repressor) of toxin-antitoxin stability system
MSRITITHLARNLADIVNRVSYRGERFVVLRGNRPVVELVPPPQPRRLGDLPGILSGLPKLGPEEATRMGRELTAAREALEDAGEGPWGS